MSLAPRRDIIVRHSTFESFEARALMTAQPVGELHLDYFPELVLNDGVAQQVEAGQMPIYAAAYEFTGLPAARTEYGLTGAGQTVAIIDSGIAWDHYALGGGIGSDYRVVGGWDFTENDANPYDDGPAGSHGTHVAGIVGSSDINNQGVAPEVDLVSLRVFDDSGTGYFSWVEQALQWVHRHRNDFANPITTVNMSLGVSYNYSAVPEWAMLENELAQLHADGIFVAVAAGNAFASFNVPGLSYPAVSTYVVPVSSVDSTGLLSSFSQRDDRVIAAPGRSIRSTVPDYVGNFNGQTDDWASFSGTSMASPYVAGASVLIRQALGRAGFSNITQDAIYNVMRTTADTIYDTVTGQNYARLNIERALESILSDDYGSTVVGAYNLGATGSASLTGAIAKADDIDYFAFTATENGTATIQLSGVSDWSPVLEKVGGGGTMSPDGCTLTFTTAAGQSYTFGVSSAAGIGSYQLNLTVSPMVVDWGTVDFKEVNNLVVGAGASWFSLTAMRDGTLTIESKFAASGTKSNLAIYNGTGQLVGSATGISGSKRFDVDATEGETFTVKVSGANSDVDFRLTNLVRRSGSTVYVYGTSGNDTFQFTAGSTHKFTVDGTTYQFAGSAVKTVTFCGGEGFDTATLLGTSDKESAVYGPGSVAMNSKSYRVEAWQTESISANAAGGDDSATFYDSSGNDSFVASPGVAAMSGSGYLSKGQGFERIEGRSGAGHDVASLYDSKGNDTLNASPTLVTLSGSGFRNSVYNFEAVHAHASAGKDTAYFTDSPGDDTFRATSTLAKMYNDSFYCDASNFDRVEARSTAGDDTALLYDDDASTLSMTGENAKLAGKNFATYVNGFDHVVRELPSAPTSASLAAASASLDQEALDRVFHWIGTARQTS